jgi:hypothetical protein
MPMCGELGSRLAVWWWPPLGWVPLQLPLGAWCCAALAFGAALLRPPYGTRCRCRRGCSRAFDAFGCRAAGHWLLMQVLLLRHFWDLMPLLRPRSGI